MTPTTRAMETVRYGVRVGLRCLGSLLLVGFVLMVLHNGHDRWRQSWEFGTGRPTRWDWIATMAAWDSVWPLLMMGVPGALALLVEKPAARWLVPTPPRGCPQCGYPTSPSLSRCPECGHALPLDPPAAPKPGERDAA